MNIQLAENETIIKEGPANHFVGMESVGGKLYLTNQRLFFKSHALNVQVHEASYRLDEIVSMKSRNTLGIVPNGMAVVLKSGQEERFVVYGRQDWMAKVTQAQAAYRP